MANYVCMYVCVDTNDLLNIVFKEILSFQGRILFRNGPHR